MPKMPWNRMEAPKRSIPGFSWFLRFSCFLQVLPENANKRAVERLQFFVVPQDRCVDTHPWSCWASQFSDVSIFLRKFPRVHIFPCVSRCFQMFLLWRFQKSSGFVGFRTLPLSPSSSRRSVWKGSCLRDLLQTDSNRTAVCPRYSNVVLLSMCVCHCACIYITYICIYILLYI